MGWVYCRAMPSRRWGARRRPSQIWINTLSVVLLLAAVATFVAGSESGQSAPSPSSATAHLLIDPELVVSRSSGVITVLSNVSKEPSSPVLVMDQPWETWLSYVSVVWAPEIGRFVLYYNNQMCCDSLNGVARCPGTENRSVYICHDSRNMNNVTGTENNPRLSATLRAESVDGVHWTKPPMHQVTYNGSTANNALRLNQSLGGTSDGRGVFRDSADPDDSRRYKMVGTSWP